MVKTFKPFDYVIIALGLIGTLNVFGALGKMPQPITVMLAVLSSMICCFSIALLALNRFVRHIDPRYQRRLRYHVFANLIPTIYLITHLTETPWERFHP